MRIEDLGREFLMRSQKPRRIIEDRTIARSLLSQRLPDVATDCVLVTQGALHSLLALTELGDTVLAKHG